MTGEEAIVLLSMIEFDHAECCLNTWYKGIDDDMKEALEMAIKALEQEPKTEPNRCNQCKYYEGVHNVQGHAPCSFLKCGGVLWDWYCSNYEPAGAESEG